MKSNLFRHAALAVGFCLTIGISSVAAEEPKTLTADEIRKAFIGNTMDHEKVWVFWGPEGKLRAKSKQGPKETGTYSISDDGIYCRQWDKWRGGEKECGKVKKVGDVYGRVLDDGSVPSTFKIVKGNPEGL